MKSKSFLVLSLTVVAIVGVAVIGYRRGHAAAQPTGVAPSSEGAGWADKHGFDISNMDTTVSACTDFFQYADGGWLAKHEIPAAFSRWGNFNELGERNRDKLHEILEASASNKNATRGSNEQKIGEYYASCMDEDAVEKAGIQPLAVDLDRIAKIKDLSNLSSEVARLQQAGAPVLFRFGVGQDFKDSTQIIAQLGQGGITLPDRDYYVSADDKMKTIRGQFASHVAKMLMLAGESASAAAADAGTVLRIETKLAEASMTRVQRRVPEAVYHRMSLDTAEKLAPSFTWDGYLKALGAGNVGDINVAQPDFFKSVDQLLTSVPLADWQTYFRWHVINSRAAALPKAFVAEDFDFNGRILTGATENQVRWKRCVTSTDLALGDALGQVYVAKAFSPEGKARALKMVQNLIAALHSDLATLSWMSETTRKRATAKLEAFTKKIGYPDKWRDYSSMKISRQAYADNIASARAYEFHRGLAKLGRPVDRTEWGMTPPTVNAYYNPSMNEIVFPAGILQWPFYDPEADDALNYGGIGAVIGHEMTHGFDDSGAKFDPQGNLSNWWTDEDLKNFKERAQCVSDEFDSFEPQPGLHQNGKLVLGESIADLGGVTIAYAAFQQSLAGKPHPAPIDGFTAEQRFFLGYAQIWAGKARPEAERQLIITDPHPLARFRVIGPLSNIPAFAQAFQCKAGDAMVRPPEKRCQIW